MNIEFANFRVSLSFPGRRPSSFQRLPFQITWIPPLLFTLQRGSVIIIAPCHTKAMAPRILVFGTGSVGTVYTYILSRAVPAFKIVTICRSNFEAASKNGFTIHSSLWGDNLKVRPVVVRSVGDAVSLDAGAHFDYVIVCSKALPTAPSTAELIKPAISAKTTIVLIQNGIATEKPYSKLFPDNSLLSTVVYLPATQIEPGIVQHKEIELLHIGPYPASSNTESATRFAALLNAGGASTKVHEDVQFERWSKLLVNASWNPICALARSRDAQILRSSPEAKDFIREVMLEIAAVANSCGYLGIDTALVEHQLGRAAVRKVGVEPSMMADALAGRNMEVEAILGNVVRLAREHVVDTPMLRTIYVLATALNNSFGFGS
jgi:2-dehydropantoate 2-reductase